MKYTYYKYYYNHMQFVLNSLSKNQSYLDYLSYTSQYQIIILRLKSNLF